MFTYGGVHDKFQIYHIVLAYYYTPGGWHHAYKIFEVFESPQEACDYANALCQQDGFKAKAV